MTEQELRVLVREAIAKAGVAAPPRGGAEVPPCATPSHSSHALFTIQGDPDGRCVIEPGVACNHCGYCKSYGH
jgi:hypothetical protein